MTIVQQIRKRDGRVVPFHENKIADAINKAFAATYKPGYEETAAKLAHEVASVLEVEGKDCPEVEHIQDIVERVLMDNGYVQTAKAYILYRSERSRAREMNTRLIRSMRTSPSPPPRTATSSGRTPTSTGTPPWAPCSSTAARGPSSSTRCSS